jgi:hypothetical protein
VYGSLGMKSESSGSWPGGQRSTVSHVIRSAVSDLVRREEQKPLRPYDQIADVIGSVAGLPPDLAATTGEQLAEIVREKAGKGK